MSYEDTARPGDGVRGMSVGHETKKVVSSADTSSVTIFILHQSPFRFAVTLLQWKRLLTTKSAYTGPPTYFHSSSTTGFPLAPIRESAIFRARFLHASDDRLPRPRTYTHTMTDRHVSIFSDWSSLESEAFQNDNYRARYGNAVCAIFRTLPVWESIFTLKENHRLCILKYDRSLTTNYSPVINPSQKIMVEKMPNRRKTHWIDVDLMSMLIWHRFDVDRLIISHWEM